MPQGKGTYGSKVGRPSKKKEMGTKAMKPMKKEMGKKAMKPMKKGMK